MKSVRVRELKDPRYRKRFNQKALHPLQSWEWGEFRKKTGLQVERWGVFEGRKLQQTLQVTIHPLPKTKLTIGYLPKGYFPSRIQTKILRKIAERHNCIMIKVEPKVEERELNKRQFDFLKRNNFVKGKPLFTKYNFVLDLNEEEDELLKKMKSKTRYNIRLAKRKGVRVEIDNSDEAFERYLELMKETTKRQGFYAHEEDYHRKMWKQLKTSAKGGSTSGGGLRADLMVARYKGKIITAWMLFRLNETMYYPYGTSTRQYRQVMASNLVMWEAIRLAKGRGCRYFDMWGALGPEPEKSDPWYGFHRFKEGYGGRLVEYMGTYDLVIRPTLYKLFRLTDGLRWKVLKLKLKARSGH